MSYRFYYIWLKSRKRDLAYEMGRFKHKIISKAILIIVAKETIFVVYVGLYAII